MMEPGRWQQVKQLFHAALEREPRERARFLAEACDGDTTLREEVARLLASHEQAESFIETPAFTSSLTETTLAGTEAAQVEGRRIGVYKIIREIGRGGMGTVYLATRDDDEYRKRGAIKLVRRGMDLDSILRRFRHERQILAGLDHPNIAKLLDGGTTDDGLPYFVMEYIEGTPIDEYCDRHKLTTTERLKLFRTVCAAVTYAHQNLVVHRDLKPGNVLIMSDGTPKLLDFGIAKLLNSELSGQTVDVTVAGLRLMTPEYASPEQVRGESITTASDVYSLGVVLYELLTGHKPYRIKTHTPQEIERVVCEAEPERPSTAVSRTEEVRGGEGTNPSKLTPETVGRVRDGQPEKLRRRLRGDLDNIVLKAMRKEPQRRYTTVNQFSEDLRRHMEGLPVSARSDTFGYRAEKFIKRHKAGVAAAVLILLTLVAGIAMTAWQAHVARVEHARAERRFNDVRKLANTFLFQFHDAIQNLPGSTPARELLVKSALEYLDSLAQEVSGDATLQRELAKAYVRVGDVQGNPYNANLGDIAGALQSYRKALTMNEALLTADGKNVEIRRDLANCLDRIGDALAVTSDVAGALNNQRKALAIREALSASDPNNPAIRRDLGVSYNKIGDALGWIGNAAEALESHRKALAIRESLAVGNATDTAARLDVAMSYNKVGDMLTSASQPAEAIRSYRKALGVAEALLAEDSLNAKARRSLAMTYNKIGDVLATTGGVTEALENQNRALKIREELVAADPMNAQARRDLAISYATLGDSLVLLEDWNKALGSVRKSVEIFEQILAADPTNVAARQDLIISYNKLGKALLAADDATAALSYYRKALGLAEEIAAKDPSDVEAQRIMTTSYTNLGKFYSTLALSAKTPAAERAGHWRDAKAWYEKSLYIWLNRRTQGTLSEVEAGEPDKIADEIARCDAALARL